MCALNLDASINPALITSLKCGVRDQTSLLNILSISPEMSPGPAQCKAEPPDQCSPGKMQTQCSAPQRGGSRATWILQVSWKSKN